jgi:hypothetical protein
MSPVSLEPPDSEILNKQLQEASDQVRIALHLGHVARHHLRIVEQRLDDLEQWIAALRYAMSRKPTE